MYGHFMGTLSYLIYVIYLFRFISIQKAIITSLFYSLKTE